MRDHLRHHRQHEDLHGTFGDNFYGRFAERIARSLGTWQFLFIQSSLLIAWVVLNGIWLVFGRAWDPFPFILLNLCLSFQAAYAAPLILVAQNRQADREKAKEDADALHRDEIASEHSKMLRKLEELLDLEEEGGITDLRDYLAEEFSHLRDDDAPNDRQLDLGW